MTAHARDPTARGVGRFICCGLGLVLSTSILQFSFSAAAAMVSGSGLPFISRVIQSAVSGPLVVGTPPVVGTHSLALAAVPRALAAVHLSSCDSPALGGLIAAACCVLRGVSCPMHSWPPATHCSCL